MEIRFFWSLLSCHDQASLFITRSHLVDCFRLFSTWLVDFSQLIHASFFFGRSIVDSTGCHLCGDIVQFNRSRPFLRYLNNSKILLYMSLVFGFCFLYIWSFHFSHEKKNCELLCFLQHTHRPVTVVWMIPNCHFRQTFHLIISKMNLLKIRAILFDVKRFDCPHISSQTESNQKTSKLLTIPL